MGRARAGVAVAILALAVPASAAAKLTQVPSAHPVFTLDPDGVLEVLEQLDVRTDDPTPTTWQITMQRGELFAQPSLVVDEQRYRPGDGKRPGTFLISRGTRGVRFDWLQPEGVHSVRLAYRLASFGTAYSDVVDLRVPVWEPGWPVPVDELTAALRLPRVPHGRVIVWVEPKSVDTTISTARAQIRVRSRNIDANTAVTLHAILPRNVLSAFDGVNVEARPGLEKILAERRGGGRSWWPWFVAAAVVVAVSAVALGTARLRRLRPR